MKWSIQSVSRLALLACAIALVAGAVGAGTAGAASPEPLAAWSLDTYTGYRCFDGAQPSPDGSRVVYTLQRIFDTGRGGWDSPVTYVAGADGSGARSLIQGRDSTEAAWSPDGRLVAFLSHDRYGVADVWVTRPGGAARQVTHVAQSVTGFAWSPDGGSIAFVSVDMQGPGDGPVVVDAYPTRANLWVVEHGRRGWLGGRPAAPRRLTDGDFIVPTFSWAPDGRAIAYEANAVGEASYSYDSDLFVLDVATGRATPLATTPAAETRPRYSPDGSRVAYVRSDLPASDFSAGRVVVAPATGPGPELVLAATPNEAPLLVGWCNDGRALLYVEYRRLATVLGVLPVDGSAARDVTLGPEPVNPVKLSPGGKWLALGTQSWEKPQELSLVKLPADSSAIVAGSLALSPVTRVNATYSALTAPRQEVITWTSDGLTIEGMLTYPVGYQTGKRYPLLLCVHGGPTASFQNDYAGLRDVYPIAVFAQRGYAVLRVNPRGSEGYGAEFRKANVKDFGGGDYRDLMRGVDAVIASGVADPARLGMMGWSYGGFMTAWTTTQSDRFLAASVGAGPVDWTSMAGTEDSPFLVPDFFGGLPWQAPDLYRDRSPVTWAGSVKTPTLILHGLYDTRVPYSQGREWYFAVKSTGTPVAMVSYPRSGHVIFEPALVRDTFERNLDWFGKYVPAD